MKPDFVSTIIVLYVDCISTNLQLHFFAVFFVIFRTDLFCSNIFGKIGFRQTK